MSELEQIKKVIIKHKEYVKKKFFVKKIGVFGSYTKSKEGTESDVDILVEFDGPIGWDFVELKDFLENILNKKVDLVSIKALKSQIKDNILNEVIYI